MKRFNKFYLRSLFTVALLAVVSFKSNGQTTMPDVLLKNTIKEQLNYLEERTKIYEYYRAIREDMFQKVKKNISDTLLIFTARINFLNGSIAVLSHTIDSLTADLENTRSKLEEVTRTKNSISLLGVELNKLTYNSITWLIISGLAAILIIGFLIFKRNLSAIHNINKDLSELKDEYQAYRKSAREVREKMSMEHFNEIKKLRGG
jgi:flagellar biosynthesis chaperone FliJ